MMGLFNKNKKTVDNPDANNTTEVSEKAKDKSSTDSLPSKKKCWNTGGFSLMFAPAVVLLSMFILVTLFSRCAFPEYERAETQKFRTEISKKYNEMISAMDKKYKLTFDSMKISEDTSLNDSQKITMTDSISKEIMCLNYIQWRNLNSIEQILDSADSTLAANLQQQVEHMETINGWWVSIMAGVATLIAVCLALQQNAGYKEQKDLIDRKLGTIDLKMHEVRSQLISWKDENKDVIDKKLKEVNKKMSEMDQSVAKVKFLKSLQSLEMISALCTYNSKTEDKLDLFYQINILLYTAKVRFGEFSTVVSGNEVVNIEECRGPLVMILQQLEIILRVLQSRFAKPYSVMMSCKKIESVKSHRIELKNVGAIDRQKIGSIISFICGSIAELNSVIDDEIKNINQKKNSRQV